MSKVLLVLVLLVGAAAAFVATRPDAYHVERSATVEAPPATIFAQIDDLSVWKEWSPWEKKDPAMKRTLSATPSGVGATYAWQGNKEVGKGKMTIVESKPGEKVVEKLEFIEPFQSQSSVTFTMAPETPTTTKVTWAMDGKHNFVSKAFSVVKPMDGMIGKDFEEGLANLKKVAEAKKPPPAPPAPPAEAANDAAAAAKPAVAPEPAKAPAEGAANGTAVGITASSSDVNGGTITYSLVDNAGGRFAIDGSTGVVTVADGTLLATGKACASEESIIIRALLGLSVPLTFCV